MRRGKATGWSQLVEKLEVRRLLAAVIEFLDVGTGAFSDASSTTITLGQGLHVRAAAGTLSQHSPTHAKYEWDFDNPGHDYNVLPGFSAAHLYESTSPSARTVRLTITDPFDLDGEGNPKVFTDELSVTIQAREWSTIYVDYDNGSDSNDGTSPSLAVKTINKAVTLLNDNRVILLKRNQTHELSSTPSSIAKNNVLITSSADFYEGSNSESLPTVKWTGAGGENVFMFVLWHTAKNVTFEGFHITAGEGRASVFKPRGRNVVIRDITFDAIQHFVNAEDPNNPVVGMLIQNNSASDDSAMLRYGLWTRAGNSNVTLLGNTFFDSLHGHHVRTYSDFILAYGNFLRNKKTEGDTSYNSLRANSGKYIYWANNTMDSGQMAVRVIDSTATDIEYVVLENNLRLQDTLDENNENPWALSLGAGAHHVMIRNNVVFSTDTMFIDLKMVEGSRQTSNVFILNNTVWAAPTAILPGNQGNFVKVGGGTTPRITLKNNLHIAPNIPGTSANGSSVRVNQSNLDDFVSIDRNVWFAQPPGGSGVNHLEGVGMLNEAAWEAYSQVGDDRFENVEVDGNYSPTGTGADFGQPVIGVWTDFYGNPRPTSGAWTAGAVQRIQPPIAPSDLTAFVDSTTAVDLSWSDNSDNESEFRIEYATNSEFTQNFASTTVGADVVSSTVANLTAGNTYYFRVYASNEAGDSAASTNVLRVTLPDGQSVSSTTLGPNADAFVRSGDHANTNYGGQAVLEVKNDASASFSRVSFIRFDLSEIASVQTATLRLWGSANTGSVTIDVFNVSDNSWSETTITWNNQPSASTTVLASQAIGTGDAWREWDLTSYVRSQYANGASEITLQLKVAGEPIFNAPLITFASKEATSAEYRPQLVVESGGTLTLDGTTQNDAFDLNVAAGTVDVSVNGSFVVYDLPIVGAIVVNGFDGDDALSVNAPAALPVTFNGGTGDDTLTVEGGTFVFNTNANAGTANLTIEVNAGTVIFNSTQHIEALNLYGSSSAIMSLDGDRHLFLRSLFIDTQAKLDLEDNDLILDYDGSSPFTTILDYIFAGYSDTLDPNKTGIVSTASQIRGGDTIHAPVDNAHPSAGATEWNGVTIDATTIILKYTYFGDVNLDGQVTGDDHAIVVSNLGMTEGASWLDGDMNFDGQVTGDDTAIVTANMGKGVGDPL